MILALQSPRKNTMTQGTSRGFLQSEFIIACLGRQIDFFWPDVGRYITIWTETGGLKMTGRKLGLDTG